MKMLHRMIIQVFGQPVSCQSTSFSVKFQSASLEHAEVVQQDYIQTDILGPSGLTSQKEFIHKIFLQNRTKKVIGTQLQLCMLPFRQIATLRILALFMMTAVTLPLSSIRKNLQMKICKNDFAFVG